MTLDQLKDKALSLPYSPGVYLMRDSHGRIIYVGKAKKLKNRVSQYFQDTASHSPKTKLMVSKVDSFDVIVAASEFEALVLECSLIKRHLPKYNILLKDDKGYPYIRLPVFESYPRLSMVNKIAEDGAKYYGPFGSRGVTQRILDEIGTALKFPDCSRSFPRDIGKGRPCLNYHMGRCEGWCRSELLKKEYDDRIEQAKNLLQGNYKSVADRIREQMLQAAADMKFEMAAKLRDRLACIEALGKKQLVTAGTLVDTDVIGYAQTETKACFSVLHFSGGKLLDKDYELFAVPDDPAAAVSSLIKQYYIRCGIMPRIVLLPIPMEDGELFAEYALQEYGRKIKFLVPQRGDRLRLVQLANENALQEANRVSSTEERIGATIALLGKMLKIDPPRRIESFDISNISGTDIVAGMVVFEDGKPRKSDYKKFKIRDLGGQDDYESMRQVIRRRFAHYIATDPGFEKKPDLLLIDGGQEHASAARHELQQVQLDIPLVGMVKDDRHRTRALITAEGQEIGIDSNQAVFSLIGTIQEETHKYAVSFHRQQRSKRLRYSQLDGIEHIGPKRKELLLKTFKSITSISKAGMEELKQILPADAATAVYLHFHPEEDNETCV